MLMGDVLSYKTRLCTNFLESGSCKYALRCRFAHGQTDLRTQEDNVRDGLYTEQALHVFQASLRHRNPSQQQNSALQPPPCAVPTQPNPSGMMTFLPLPLTPCNQADQGANKVPLDIADMSHSSMSVSQSAMSQPSGISSGGFSSGPMFMPQSLQPVAYPAHCVQQPGNVVFTMMAPQTTFVPVHQAAPQPVYVLPSPAPVAYSVGPWFTQQPCVFTAPGQVQQQQLAALPPTNVFTSS